MLDLETNDLLDLKSVAGALHLGTAGLVDGANGDDLARSPAATALDAAAGGLPASPGCGAVEAPTMSL